MSEDTILQFNAAADESAATDSKRPRACATCCATCGSHFSPDGRFCPFDATPLVPAEGWDPTADALIGSTVDGRYEVAAVIGEGGMGKVYEVRHKALGKRFALKALRKDLAADGEIAARFIQEARTAAAVSHPGLVEITDFGHLQSGQVYFVMELLEGRSLASLLRSGGPMPAERGLDIIKQLAHALKAAHDSSIVHRDLKPDNIYIGRGDGGRDLVKIVDFGLAKVIGSSKLTRSGTVFGTPHYMSPEQASGELVDHRADIYSLGVVMYEMFTGKVPFEADSYIGVLSKHIHAPPTPPSELCAELAQLGALESVILRCLQKRPSARYANLSGLLADLEPGAALLEGERGAGAAGWQPRGPVAARLEPPSGPELRSRRRLLAPLALVATAFVAGLVLVIRAQSGARSRAPQSSPGPSVRATSSASFTAAGPIAELASGVPSATSEPAPGPSARPGRTPARKSGAAGPRRAPSAVPAVGARRPTSREIVDPWAR